MKPNTRQEAFAYDVFSSSVVKGLFLPFVGGILFDAGFKSPLYFGGLLALQKLLLSISKNSSEAASRIFVFGVIACIGVVYDVTFVKHPNEIAFVLLGLFYWAADKFFPSERQSARPAEKELDLVELAQTFGVPILGTVLYVVGGKYAVGLVTIAVILFNAVVYGLSQGNLFKSGSSFVDQLKHLDDQSRIYLLIFFLRKYSSEGLDPLVFPGYYAVSFGVGTAYLGAIYAARMAAFRFRREIVTRFPEVDKLLNSYNGYPPIALSVAIVVVDILFRGNLVLHLGLGVPLRVMAGFLLTTKVQELNLNKELVQWVEMPLDLVSCLIAGVAYSILPLSYGLAIQGFTYAITFALFLPQVQSALLNALAQLKKQTPPPLPPKPKPAEKKE